MCRAGWDRYICIYNVNAVVSRNISIHTVCAFFWLIFLKHLLHVQGWPEPLLTRCVHTLHVGICCKGKPDTQPFQNACMYASHLRLAYALTHVAAQLLHDVSTLLSVQVGCDAALIPAMRSPPQTIPTRSIFKYPQRTQSVTLAWLLHLHKCVSRVGWIP
jgi:hypothetical protein